MDKFKCVILHNIISPYKTLLFNALVKVMEEKFAVLYIAETERIRDWKVEKDNLKFSFDVMFKGQIDNISPFKMLIETFRKLNLYDPEVIIIGG